MSEPEDGPGANVAAGRIARPSSPGRGGGASPDEAAGVAQTSRAGRCGKRETNLHWRDLRVEDDGIVTRLPAPMGVAEVTVWPRSGVSHEGSVSGRGSGLAAVSERENREIEAANAAGGTPVVFIHGL